MLGTQPLTQPLASVISHRSIGFADRTETAFNLGERMEDWKEEEIEDEKDLGLRGAAKRMVKCIVRTIRDFAQLFDVSVVTSPAYEGTSVSPRSLQLCAEFRSRAAKAIAMTDEQLLELGNRTLNRWFEEAQADKARRNRLSQTILEL